MGKPPRALKQIFPALLSPIQKKSFRLQWRISGAWRWRMTSYDGDFLEHQPLFCCCPCGHPAAPKKRRGPDLQPRPSRALPTLQPQDPPCAVATSLCPSLVAQAGQHPAAAAAQALQAAAAAQALPSVEQPDTATCQRLYPSLSEARELLKQAVQRAWEKLQLDQAAEAQNGIEDNTWERSLVVKIMSFPPLYAGQMVEGSKDREKRADQAWHGLVIGRMTKLSPFVPKDYLPNFEWLMRSDPLRGEEAVAAGQRGHSVVVMWLDAADVTGKDGLWVHAAPGHTYRPLLRAAIPDACSLFCLGSTRQEGSVSFSEAEQVYAIHLLLGLDIPPQASRRCSFARCTQGFRCQCINSRFPRKRHVVHQDAGGGGPHASPALADLPRRLARFVSHPCQSAMSLYHFVKYNVIVFLTKRTTSLHPFRGRTLLSHLRPPHAS